MTDARSMSSGPRRHRRTESEISAASYASAASVDKSVEPAVLDPTRSAMFKDVTLGGQCTCSSCTRLGDEMSCYNCADECDTSSMYLNVMFEDS